MCGCPVPDPERIVGVIYVVLGGAFAVAGPVGLCLLLAFHPRAVRCLGVVDDSRPRPGRPVVAFRTADGRDVRTAALVGSRRRYRPGGQVTVIYDPRGPGRAYAGSTAWLTVFLLALTAFGAFQLLVGLAKLGWTT